MIWYDCRDGPEERNDRDLRAPALRGLQWTPWAGGGQFVIWDVVMGEDTDLG